MTSEIWIFEVIFVEFRLMKNIILNKTESFVTMPVKYFAPKVTETMYHWFFLLKITVVKIMNNLNVYSAHSYLYPQSRFNYIF
jgi:hypothetical protein